ncbi:MAG: hypothetical protein SFY96_03035 [Planctomycetota bacterium]|nr:hypothetical protein [Planctomycetota bacterium]
MSDTPSPQPPSPSQFSDDDLKRAMHAFKKRLKLTKLDQESRLGAGRQLTSGKKSDVQGIIPPNDFPAALWRELANRKQLKDMGGGFYGLPNG